MCFFACYLACVNLTAAALVIYDKHRARTGGWRIRESTLLALAVLGGGAAMYPAMRLCHHKTRKKKFMIGIPLVIALQLCLALILYIRYG